jgi:hypothetical protein
MSPPYRPPYVRSKKQLEQTRRKVTEEAWMLLIALEVDVASVAKMLPKIRALSKKLASLWDDDTELSDLGIKE